jgi:glycosyltransferase involved in cell wall biosynthesis
VSTGFDKTHMTTAAREALDRKHLALAITGAYPTQAVVRWARRAGFAEQGRLGRLLDRGEGIPAERIRALWVPELVYAAGKALARVPHGEPSAQRVCVAGWRLYGRLAARHLARAASAPEIYHFRAGYGQASIERARRLGMRVVCDHAIAHPAMLEVLMGERDAPEGRLHAPINRAALRDIERSDCVLVNSDFVKETFLRCGWAADRVHVIYLGVDDNFLRHIPVRPRPPANESLTLLFAGRLERRKGVDVLAGALEDLDEIGWTLQMAGPVAPEAATRHRRLMGDPRVTFLGNLRRRELVAAMVESAVFVFPSLAEGSARVVFEALACGCYVITTPTAGTIVEDGVHGALVPPGDVRALREAIVAAAADPARVARIGAANATLVRERYRQRHYGDALQALYRGLLGPTSEDTGSQPVARSVTA